ncbi:hypothetical protein F5884DRAFT_780454 [Xylogone sp. PMI_703]|nr:hypothetical protein F5884DRAFT_780454 [Xylogone sp. PMI_703]
MDAGYERVPRGSLDAMLLTTKEHHDEENLLQGNDELQYKGSQNMATKGIVQIFNLHNLRLLRNIVVVLLALWGLFSINYSIFISEHHASRPKHCYCGNSTTEAISLGCKFDSLAAAWLPPYCRDEDLTAEFERSGPGSNGEWTYFADAYHKVPMSMDQVAALADNQSAEVMMTRDWHVSHCLFYWKKLYRQRFRQADGGIIEPSFDTETHINHCMGVILGDSWGTKARIALDS